MKKFLQKKLNNEKGMTLIELLAVIVIIAIIAAIAIPAIGNIIENSRVGATKSDILNAQSAAELYIADNPSKTTVTLNDLLGGVTSGSTTTTTGSSYLDSKATLISFSYNKATNSITAQAYNDGVNIKATNATKANLAELPSNTKGSVEGGNTGTSTIVVTRGLSAVPQ